MRTRLLSQLAALLVLLLATSANGLFFHYPKNVLLDFFQSLHHKKEVKKPPHNIHHYHLHYYPVHTQYLTKSVKAPTKFELDKLHGNHLESLGWNDHEFPHIPDPEIYQSPPLHDPWPEASISRPSVWDDESPNYPHETLEQPEVPKSGIIVQVPIHQKIVVQQTPEKEEKGGKNPFLAFFQGFHRLKNSLFSHRDGNDEARTEKPPSNENANGYVVYVQREFGRKL